MRCSSCHHNNRSDQRFCTECGTEVVRTCSSCGTPIEVGAKLCGACGFVDEFTGDGGMALIGAPIALEDHAQRACYAALHLRDAARAYASEVHTQHGVPFAVRIGLNSGEVVVGRIGDDLRMEFTAVGHVALSTI